MTVDLEEFSARIERSHEGSRTAARARLDNLALPNGSLGALEDLAVWLAGTQGASPTRPLEQVRVVVFAADHGIASAGVSAYAPEATAALVRLLLAGTAATNALIRQTGAVLRVVDVGVDADTDGPTAQHDVGQHKVRRGSGRIDVEDALTMAEVEQAFAAGAAVADEEIDSGADLLVAGNLGVASSTPAAALIGLLAQSDASVVTGRGSGIDDAAWMRKCAAVRDAMRRGRPHLRDDLALLACVTGADLAAMVGFLLQAAARRTPVVLDGIVSAAAALAGQRIAFRAVDWWLAGHLSPEPAHALALDRLLLEPVLTMGLRLGAGTGGLIAVPLVQAAGLLLAETATYDEAGLTPPA